MIFGAAYINLTSDKKLYRQINNFIPPVMSIFFIVSGMNLDLTALTTVGGVGLAHFIVVSININSRDGFFGIYPRATKFLT